MKHISTTTTVSALLVFGLLTAAGCGDDSMPPPDAGTDAPIADAGGDSGGDAGGDSGTDAGPGGYDFRTDAPTAYSRVDRMGMPAVSTALIPSDMKTGYNDDDPAADLSGGDCPATPTDCKYAGAIIGSIDAIHSAVGMTSSQTVDEQLAGAGLTACAGGAACATQEVAPGAPVYSFVIPDVITVNRAEAAGFPNGRRPEDTALDIELGLLLLDLTVHGPGTLTDLDGDGTPGPSVNPLENDVPFSSTFPYLAAAHTP